MPEINHGEFVSLFPKNLSDLGPHGPRLESALASLEEISGRFFPAQAERGLAKGSAIHSLRLFLVHEMLARKAAIPRGALRTIFSVLGGELEFLANQKGIPGPVLSHYRLLQEVAAIKARHYSAQGGNAGEEEPENLQEINAAAGIHSKFISAVLGKKCGEFERELHGIASGLQP